MKDPQFTSPFSAFFTKQLIDWYNPDDRPMPWKGEKDPYKIWISEVILQQTRVEQGWDYYLRFIHTFPTIQDLASAQIDAVLSLWQGLGYYSRARNLHKGAIQIIEEYNGILPPSYPELLKIKSIGPYTAAAIASFVFDLPYSVLDGNVVRVLSRFFGIFTPFQSNEGKHLFQSAAQTVLDRQQPALYNQAIMDFGATVCTPAQPDCNHCPLQKHCHAYNADEVRNLPVRLPKSIRKVRYFHYIVFRSGPQCLIFQRKGKDIYHGLYQFYLIEADSLLSSVEITHRLPRTQKPCPSPGKAIVLMPHILTHQRIIPAFFIMEVSAFPDIPDAITARPDQLSQYAFPQFVKTFIEKYLA